MEREFIFMSRGLHTSQYSGSKLSITKPEIDEQV